MGIPQTDYVDLRNAVTAAAKRRENLFELLREDEKKFAAAHDWATEALTFFVELRRSFGAAGVDEDPEIHRLRMRLWDLESTAPPTLVAQTNGIYAAEPHDGTHEDGFTDLEAGIREFEDAVTETLDGLTVDDA